ncbi:hypothetical protein GCM10009555_071880 [Acrocarpospora macrocephala]|uniref:Cell wall synthesis protein Wag31 n=2 Tax=Acrocarpospora macrocephala TaxID=150177 RepID=A0A5M3WJ09_9ACTN|nr:hypothetical protein Amac_022620 [Acrocarpospora macrocephala]
MNDPMTDRTLTADDVRAKVFTTGRLREGYDLAEVDVFLNEVAASLRRLHQENAHLKGLVADPKTATLLIVNAREQAETIISEAQDRARALEEETRERLRRATDILAEAHTAGVRELDRWRTGLEDQLAQIKDAVATS